MRILLPPSEGKTPADPNCAPIRLDNLVYPRLTDKRPVSYTHLTLPTKA